MKRKMQSLFVVIAFGFVLVQSVFADPQTIYVVAGQSLAAGSAHRRTSCENEHAYSGFFKEDGKVEWVHCSDPQYKGGYRFLNPILERFSLTSKARGSWVPALGEYLGSKKNEVGFINVAVGSTSISDWQPEAPIFQNLQKALALNPKAVLWEQGGTDSEMSKEDYQALLSRMIHAMHKTGWNGDVYVAIESWNGKCKAESVQQAQQTVIDRGLAKQGPNLDEIEQREQDKLHFNWRGNQRAALLWYIALKEGERQ